MPQPPLRSPRLRASREHSSRYAVALDSAGCHEEFIENFVSPPPAWSPRRVLTPRVLTPREDFYSGGLSPRTPEPKSPRLSGWRTPEIGTPRLLDWLPECTTPRLPGWQSPLHGPGFDEQIDASIAEDASEESDQQALANDIEVAGDPHDFHREVSEFSSQASPVLNSNEISGVHNLNQFSAVDGAPNAHSYTFLGTATSSTSKPQVVDDEEGTHSWNRQVRVIGCSKMLEGGRLDVLRRVNTIDTAHTAASADRQVRKIGSVASQASNVSRATSLTVNNVRKSMLLARERFQKKFNGNATQAFQQTAANLVHSMSSILAFLDIEGEGAERARSLGNARSTMTQLSFRMNAVTSKILLRRFSGHFAYGTKLTDNAFSVDKIDDFISHSWRGSRIGKYLTLTLMYNSVVASLVSLLVTIVAFAIWPHLPPMSGSMSDGSEEMSLYCSVSGTVAYVLVLLFFQRARAACGCRLRTGFLDRICIDQTSSATMQQGLDQLSALVLNSRRFVILWDPTYFTRAWCILEVATRAHYFELETANILFLPLCLVQVVASLYIVIFLSYASMNVVRMLRQTLQTFEVVIILVINISIELVFLTKGFAIGRAYMRDRNVLRGTLRQFDFREDAKASVESDLKAITACILLWFGSVAEFNQHITQGLRKLIFQQLGSESTAPIVYQLPLVSVSITCLADSGAHGLFIGRYPAGSQVLLWSYILCVSFCGMPLMLSIFLRLCYVCQKECESLFRDFALCMLLSVVMLIWLGAIIWLPQLVFEWYEDSGDGAWMATEILLCVFLVLSRLAVACCAAGGALLEEEGDDHDQA